jgi:MFS transporter, CP family, cyanate transporter
VLVLLAILLVAANLRVAVSSVGALLDEVNAGLRLNPIVLGAITALPTLAFAAFGALTPRLNRRFEPTTLLLSGMGLLVLGQVLRALTSSVVVFIAASAAALAGIAVSNILLPVLVKRYFPHRLGMVTGLYTVAMIAGNTIAAAASVPVADLAGSWRAGIGVWAVFAALAAIPVLLLHRKPASAPTEPHAHRPIRPSRSRLGWVMAILFGTQSFSGYAIMGWLPHVYRDAGFSSQTAGLRLALLIGAGLPFALLMPTIAARWTNQRALMLGISAAMLAAYLGLACAPRWGGLLWLALLAIGQSVFPLTLVLIGMRARTHAGTVALSAFTQCVGYVIAAAGPLSVGLLYQATGGWLASFGVLIAALAVQTWAGVWLVRPRMLEDEIGIRRVTARTTVVAEVTDVTSANTLSNGSCTTPVRVKPAKPGTVGATAGLTERVGRRRPHGPRMRWNIGRHESPRPRGRR